MGGSKYPTLSISLFTYVKLHTKLRKFQRSAEVQMNSSLRNGISSAHEKLMKYFDRSTYESEYYYFAADSFPVSPGSDAQSRATVISAYSNNRIF